METEEMMSSLVAEIQFDIRTKQTKTDPNQAKIVLRRSSLVVAKDHAFSAQCEGVVMARMENLSEWKIVWKNTVRGSSPRRTQLFLDT
jgi:hypothetical protein